MTGLVTPTLVEWLRSAHRKKLLQYLGAKKWEGPARGAPHFYDPWHGLTSNAGGKASGKVAITLPPELSIAQKLNYFSLTTFPPEAGLLPQQTVKMPTSTLSNTKVSFDDELLIAVDPEDNVCGYPSKASAHMGSGTLHRAFSIFLFNDNSEVLLQKRSKTKLLWPEYWSNSCCSHPRKGEKLQTAAHRRLAEELGCEAALDFIYRFTYQACYLDIGSEHELCSVFVGTTSESINPNDSEIDEHKWIDYDSLDKWIHDEPGSFTPWFKSEWELMRSGTLSAELSGLGRNSPSL